MSLWDAAEAAAQHVRSWPAGSTVRIVAHQDPDGVAAAAVAVRWLARAGRRFHATFTWRRGAQAVAGLERDRDDPLLFLDLGADDLAELSQLTTHGLVIDHHPVPDGPGNRAVGGWTQLNPWMTGLDGGHDACGATTTLAAAVAHDEANWDLAAIALAGAVGDMQHRPDFTGFNRDVAKEAATRGHLAEATVLDADDLPLADLVRWPTGAWADALAGTDGAAWLSDLGLPAEATADDLDASDRQRLASAVALRLIGQGADATRVKSLTVRRAVDPARDHAPLTRIASLLEATARLGEPGTGLAYLLGDETAATEASGLEAEFRAAVRTGMQRVDQQADEKPSHRWARVDDVRIVSAVATMALGRVVDADRPLVVVAEGEDGYAVSARADARLVADGLDLGRALGRAAEAVGGRGGGHAAAAGCRVPPRRLTRFRQALEAALDKEVVVRDG